MGLQSKLFKGDAKLEAAANSDPAHIAPGAKGSHVGKIQQALIKLDGAAITADSAYGPATATAVAAFKQKRQILNFAGKIDNIVGKKTIARLDEEMLAKEGGGGSVGTGGAGKFGLNFAIPAGLANSIGAGSPVTIQPFTRSPMILIKTFDKRDPDSTKNDLNNTNPPQPKLTFLETLAVGLSIGDPVSLLEFKMSLELRTLAGIVGLDMFQRFKLNTFPKKVEEFNSGHGLGKLVEGLDVFKKAHDSIRSEFEDALKKQAATGTLDVNALEAKTNTAGKFGRPQLTNPDGIKTSLDLAIPRSQLQLQAVIGGSFQGGQAELIAFSADANTGTYTATFKYIMIDHFGVDNGDVLGPPPHGSPGQVAFWVLQHTHGPGFCPYLTTVILERSVSGRFI